MPKLPRNVRLHDRSGRYRAVLTIDRKRVVGPLRDTPAEAARDVARLREKNRAPSRRLPTLDDAFTALLSTCERTGARQGTVDFYRNHWRIVVGESGWSKTWEIDALDPEQVYRYARKREGEGVALSTIWQKEIYTLRRAIRCAIKDRLIGADPLATLEQPRIRGGRFGVIAGETVERIVLAVRNYSQGRADKRVRDALVIEFLYCSGLRLSETSRIRAEDIDFDTGRLFVDGKTGDRHLPHGDRLRSVLREAVELAAPGGPIFGTVKTLEKICPRWQKRLRSEFGDVPLCAHVLRHSFATRAVEQGVQPFQLAALMGHSDIRETQKYYHASDEAQKAALDAIAGDHGQRSGSSSSRSASLSRRRNASSRRSTDRASTDANQASTAD